MSDLIEKEQGILPDNNEKKSTRKKISLKIKKQDINKENNVISSELKPSTETQNSNEANKKQTENNQTNEKAEIMTPTINISDMTMCINTESAHNNEINNEKYPQNSQYQSNNNSQNSIYQQGQQENYQYNNGKNRFWNRGRDRNFQSNNQQPEEEYIINTEQVLYVKDLREKSLDDLLKIAEEYEVQNLNRMLRQDIITAILKQSAAKGEGIYCDGLLEIIDDGYGFLRDMKNNYKSSSYDVYISSNQIKKLGLRQGDQIGAYIKEPKRGEKYFAIARLETVNGKKLDEIKNKINFDNLIPLYPTEKLKFDYMKNQKESISTRVIDLISPIGKGQRALIVAPPRAGKTFLMQAIAHAINENHPESELIVLLIDERPEEVTDMSRSVNGEVVSSTFDEPAKRHVELAEIVIEKAKRMVEDGKDVIILLDSITRLARAYNAVAPSSGKVLTGGVDSNALQKPKRFFGAARNIENGGSLTIIATALIETGSKMDEVIFEEFKGTGNAEIVLSRQLADKRLFPAIDILKSGTRKEEEMVSKDDLQKMWILRRILITMAGQNSTNSADALEFLLDKLKKSKNNEEFFALMNSSK